jgi:CheY-like chemotaxis protein
MKRTAKAMNPVPVLLVDDDIELCASLARLLGMEGFTATAAHDAEAAVREALSNQHELIVLDVMLPGGDGRKVLRRIRMSSRLSAQTLQSARTGGPHARRATAQRPGSRRGDFQNRRRGDSWHGPQRGPEWRRDRSDWGRVRHPAAAGALCRQNALAG